MRKLFIGTFLFFLAIGLATGSYDFLADFSEDALPVLNNSLARFDRRMLDFEDGVSLAEGGTGAALTDPDDDRILFWDDSAGVSAWLDIGSNLEISGTTLNGISLVGIEFFTSNGTFTASSGITKVFVSLVGGGAAGRDGITNNSQGGGGGGAAESFIRVAVDVTPASDYTIVVGAGGKISSANGADSSFAGDDITLTASGGTASVNYQGGVGATAASLDAVNGVAGIPSFAGGNGGNIVYNSVGGGGGGSRFGNGGAGGTSGVNGHAGYGYGSGGGGGFCHASATSLHGDGADGFVLVEWYD